LARGVIKPQNGHILCDWNCRESGLNIARSLPKKAETGFIAFALSPPAKHDRAGLMILSRIAHIEDQSFWGDRRGIKSAAVGKRIRSEQFRPAIATSLSDHDAGDEHFLSLFQVL
jgi:hypothetical protein